MSSRTLADRPQAEPQSVILESPSIGGVPAEFPALRDRAAWEHLLMAEDDLADAPPIPLEAMRRETLYGD